MTDPLGQGLSFRIRFSADLLLESGGKLFIPLEGAGTVTGEYQASHGRAQRLFRAGIECQTPSSDGGGFLSLTCSQQIVRVTSQHLDRAKSNGRSLAREPVLEFRGPGYGETFEELAGNKARGRFPVSSGGKLL